MAFWPLTAIAGAGGGFTGGSATSGPATQGNLGVHIGGIQTGGASGDASPLLVIGAAVVGVVALLAFARR